jgi:cytochrome P450
MADASDVPLIDPSFHVTDPWEAYRRLRDDEPVHWCESGGFWAITRYEDVLTISKNPRTFCNGQGMTMRGAELEDVKDVRTLLTIDPPDHTSYRALVSRSFTPGAVRRLEAHISDITRDVLDTVPLGQPIDFVDVVAARVPVIVIAELLGIPVEDREKFVEWSNAGIGAADPEFAPLRERAGLEQYAYFEDILSQRRVDPRDDLLSLLIGAEGEQLTHTDVLTMCYVLLAAGNETTRNLISRAVIQLVDHPDQLDRLRDGGDIRTAIEELMRWTSPVIHMARTATEDVEMRGQLIKAGEQVVMFYGAANRDHRAFGPTAEELDVGRDPNPQLGFGFGTHYCLGASLARLEAAAVLGQLVDRFRRWEVVGPVEPLQSTMIRGIKHLPAVLYA